MILYIGLLLSVYFSICARPFQAIRVTAPQAPNIVIKLVASRIERYTVPGPPSHPVTEHSRKPRILHQIFGGRSVLRAPLEHSSHKGQELGLLGAFQDLLFGRQCRIEELFGVVELACEFRVG